MCRSRRELLNADLLAKFDFDTAENEPSKIWKLLAQTVRWLHNEALADEAQRASMTNPTAAVKLHSGVPWCLPFW